MIVLCSLAGIVYDALNHINAHPALMPALQRLWATIEEHQRKVCRWLVFFRLPAALIPHNTVACGLRRAP